MKQTINQFQFHDAFNAIRPNNFTYEGLTALYYWLEEYEESTGDEVELDVIALCCEFTEYSTAKEALEEYGQDTSEYDGLGVDWLLERTTVIEFDTGVIIGEF